MSMFGGMLSFEVKGGRDPAMKVTTSTKIFTRATSLGGVESLIRAPRFRSKDRARPRQKV